MTGPRQLAPLATTTQCAPYERAEVLGITRYVQVRTVQDPEIYRRFQARNDGAPEPFDGIAELWYDELAPAGSRTEAARIAAQELLADERNFIDLASSPMWMGEEWPVVK